MSEAKSKTQRDGPFTVKFLQGSDKALILDAAARAKLNIGEWVALAAREKVMREREPGSTSGMTASGQDEVPIPVLPDSHELSVAYALLKQIAADEGKPVTPRNRIKAAVKRGLRARLATPERRLNGRSGGNGTLLVGMTGV